MRNDDNERMWNNVKWLLRNIKEKLNDGNTEGS